MPRVPALVFVSVALSIALSLAVTLATRLAFRSRSAAGVQIPT